MSVDWNAIAAEVHEALLSIGETDDGFPVALQVPGTQSGSDLDPTFDPPTYVDLVGLQDVKQVRDGSGTLVKETMRTILVSATTGVEPSKEMSVSVGVKSADIDSNTVWEEILEVRPLSPAGTAALYEIDLKD